MLGLLRLTASFASSLRLCVGNLHGRSIGFLTQRRKGAKEVLKATSPVSSRHSLPPLAPCSDNSAATRRSDRSRVHPHEPEYATCASRSSQNKPAALADR